jgi:iron complex outermembrane receptor protein
VKPTRRIAFLLLALARAALAADAAPLEPVVVSAARAPQPALTVPTAVDTVEARDLHLARAGIDLTEALARVPGLVVRDRENHAQDLQLSLRGFGARASFGVRGLRLYSDGIPASAPDGQGQVSHFPLESAARIEVLRGPFSALYGNASGGVIALTSADAPAHPRLRFGVVAGANGLRRHALSFHTPWHALDGGLLFDAVDLTDRGYRDHSAATRRTDHLALSAAHGDWALRVIGNHLALVADDPQGLTAAQVAADRRAASAGALAFDTRKTVRQDQSGLNLAFTPDADVAFHLTAWDGNRATTQMLSVPVAVQANPLHGGGALGLDRAYDGMDLRARWTFGADAAFTLGLQREASAELRRGYENFSGAQLGVYGALRREELNRVVGRDAYAQLEWQPAPDWHAQAGLRRSLVAFTSDDRYITASNPDDSGRRAFAATTPVLGVLYRATPTTSLYANAGRGFETPTGAELAYRADGLSGLNTSLDPTRSLNLEAGLRQITGTRRLGLALFRTRTADELVVLSSAGGRTVFRNAAGSTRRGLEISTEQALGAHWRHALAYTALHARYDTGERIPGLARHSLWSELVWSPRADLDLRLEGRYLSAVYADDANTARAPSYAAFDLAAERRWQFHGMDLKAYARLDNLLDRAYIGSVIVNEANGRYYEPAPGRRWQAGLALSRDFD